MMSMALLLAALMFQDAAAATSATPAPQSAAPSSMMRFTGKAVPPEQRALAPYELVKGLIVFKVIINGRETWAILDTGASRSLVDLAFAQAAGMDVGPPSATANIQTGSIPAHLVKNASILIPGQLQLEVPQIGAIDMAPIQAVAGRKIEFILGDEVMGAMAVAIDPGRRTLRFGASGAARPAAGFPVVDLHDEGRQVDMMIGAKPVRVQIDTGSALPLNLTPEAWARVGSPDLPMKMGSSTGADGMAHMTDIVTVPSVTLGPITRQNVEITIRPWTTGVDGSVGMGFLEGVFLVRDRKAGKLWLLPRLPSVVSPPAVPAPAPPG